MGAVYLVEHVHTGEHLALKVLVGEEAATPEGVERFKREARAPAKIRSDHVVRVTDADVAPELGGAPFMVMEALNGQDLGRVLTERGKLPPADVTWIMAQVASALDKAHAIGIVHRDLKPENLFLHTRDDGSRIVKILDFGISKMKSKDGDVAAAGLTQTGAMMGTPFYMAPEQARGLQSAIGPATDVWALGLVTLRLLTGEIYWGNVETLGDLLMRIMSDPMPPPSVRFPTLGVNLDAWFARSCARDPALRFASVGEQVRALAAAFNDTSSARAVQEALGAGSPLGASVPVLPAPATGPAGNVGGGTVVIADAPGTSPGPIGQAVPFLQSTGGGIVRPGATDPTGPPRGVGIVLGAVGAVLALVLVSAFLVVPRLSHRATPAASNPAASTAPTTVVTPTTERTTPVTTVAFPPEASSVSSADVIASAAPASSRPAPLLTAATVPRPTLTRDSPRPTPPSATVSTKPKTGPFNPEAP